MKAAGTGYFKMELGPSEEIYTDSIEEFLSIKPENASLRSYRDEAGIW